MWLLDPISSHTPRAPVSLTEGGWPSQFPFWVVKKESFSQPRSAHMKGGFRTKRESVLGRKAKGPSLKGTPAMLCLRLYTKMQSLVYKTRNRAPALTIIGQVTRVTG